MKPEDMPRHFRLFADSKTPSPLGDLRHVVLSLIQEVAVLRSFLEEEGLDKEEYKRRRREVMVGDHGGPGPAPWVSYSYYRFTLEEKEFLKQVLGMNDAEIASFDRDAGSRQTMT